MTNLTPKVTIFCDGGSQPNPGPGGFGVLLTFDDGREQELSGAELDTTNNKMELTAACVALESLDVPHEVTMYVDSQYVRKGITEWMPNWVKCGWKTADGEPVKNQELWERLYEATQRHTITWRWVRGHSGNANNERVDQLATKARETLTGIPSESAKSSAKEAKKAAPKAEANGDVKVYISGQYSWDVKAGGWGAYIIDKDGSERELGGTIRDETSGNRVALLAAINALEAVADTPGSLDIFTDQEYLSKGMSSWLDGWIKKGWRTAGGQPVKNQDLWEELHKLAKKRKITWHQVRVSDQNFQRAMMTASRKIRW